VDVSAEGPEGVHYALEYDYDAIILDVMLPGMDGYRVLESIRARKQTPILMLSARGSVDERVKGLRLGADDYLPKPFSLIELVARIQALVRRWGNDGLDITQLQLHDLHIDILARRVFRGNIRLELSTKEFSLLSLLARHQGEIMSKMMIAEQVWDMNFRQ
jgi:two-component system, OmpR family, copper resistance phosphate regulon response regulator CusR